MAREGCQRHFLHHLPLPVGSPLQLQDPSTSTFLSHRSGLPVYTRERPSRAYGMLHTRTAGTMPSCKPFLLQCVNDLSMLESPVLPCLPFHFCSNTNARKDFLVRGWRCEFSNLQVTRCKADRVKTLDIVSKPPTSWCSPVL